MDFCPHCMYPASGPVCKRCGKPTSWTPGEQQLPAGTMLDGSGLHRYLTGAAIGQGKGRSKKEAEQMAAKAAIQKLSR